MHEKILVELLVIFTLSVMVLYLCHQMRIAPILGFLLTGAMAGPFGFSLISSVKEVELLAEIGVMLLLFTIGMELSLAKLVEIKKAIFIGGSLQVGLTILAGGGVALALGIPANQSVFLGFLVALSSTAIVLKVLQERGEVGSTHGSAATGVLIFQDLIVVPMLLLVPLLAGKAEDPVMELGLFAVKLAVIGVVLWYGARRLIPAILYRIVRLRDPELFILAVIVIGLGIAWLTGAAGLSLALGAFLAGLIISESEYGHQAFASVLPFRDIFTSLFFISIGMLMDMGFLWANMGMVILATLGIVLVKALLAGGSVYASQAGFAAAVAAGVSLAQIGEFSFVLARGGMANDLLSQDLYQFFLAVSVVTMAMTPFLTARARWLGRAAAQLPAFKGLAFGKEISSGRSNIFQDHLIIIGFGENGRAMAQLACHRGIPHLVLETNPETVRHEKAAGIPIHFGDATRIPVLKHAGIMNAHALLVTVPDAVATRNIVDTARHLRKDLPIIARASFLTEVEPLKKLGADHVVAMQLEASVALCEKTLGVMGFSSQAMADDLSELRANRILTCRIPFNIPQEQTLEENQSSHKENLSG